MPRNENWIQKHQYRLTGDAMESRNWAIGPLRAVALLCVFAYSLATPFEHSECYGGEGDFFQFSVGTLDGGMASFDQFKGRVMIALNVASFWGYTPQYRTLNALKTEYGLANGTAEDPKKCYLDVVGFPCNQFGHQEPSENFELMNTLKHVRPGYGFVPNFLLTGKLLVNGQDESPVFTFLKVCIISFSLSGRLLKYIMSSKVGYVVRFQQSAHLRRELGTVVYTK